MFLTDYLDQSAHRFPEKVALTDGRSAMTFGELATFSDHLGSFLMGLGVSCEDRVAYFLKRGPDCIATTMGILKSGAAYVPLDQKTPLERWRRIVQDAAPAALVCHRDTLAETLERTQSLGLGCPIICISPREPGVPAKKLFFLEDIARAPLVSFSMRNRGELAQILYTSGSTGAPKGVMITHSNVRNYIDWAIQYFNINSDDHILGTAPFYFDMSTFDIFSALAAGATLSLATEDILVFPAKLVRFIEEEKVTFWKGVASLLMYMCRAGVVRPGRMPTLRTVIYAGEPLNPQYLSQWMEAYPEKSFYNGYGPTEATGVSLCYYIERAPVIGQSIPIGYPRTGMEVVLLDDDSRPVMPGEVGELCIAGRGLAKGYLNDPEKTKKQFTPPPPGFQYLGDRIYHTGDLARQNSDGSFVFIARKDHQVKWMGYRIELADIESNLIVHPQVRDVAVVLAETAGGLSELTACFEADGSVDAATLSHFLENRLPHYMIPKRFIQMTALPRNDRGKIARDELLKRCLEADLRSNVKNS